MITHQEDDSPKPIGVIDKSGDFIKSLPVKISEYRLKDKQPNYILRNLDESRLSYAEIKRKADSLILGNFIDACVAINKQNGSLKVEYRSRTAGGFKDIKRFENAVNQIRIENEFRKKGADTSLIRIVSSNIEIGQFKVTREGKVSKSDFLGTFLSSLVFIIVLMMTILSSGGMLIRSLVEEKSSRLIEILVSSCNSRELLGGKVIGLSLLGLLQVLVWGLLSALLVNNNIIPADTFSNILPMLLYFALGYCFYSALFVGIGSVVSTEQEAQIINGYLAMFLLVPIIFLVPVIENPESLLVRILSYVPFTSPTIMILRLNVAQISFSEILLTIIILAASTAAAVVFAAKIFRIGILSYGKMPKLKELISWMKEK
jgi:ABC-2 type transport system permease protein